MNVTIAYVDPNTSIEINLDLPEPCSAAAAIQQSKILDQLPALPQPLSLGVYGKKINDSEMLSHNDRIEIYRPLIVDPKTARRLRAKKKAKKN